MGSLLCSGTGRSDPRIERQQPLRNSPWLRLTGGRLGPDAAGHSSRLKAGLQSEALISPTVAAAVRCSGQLAEPGIYHQPNQLFTCRRNMHRPRLSENSASTHSVRMTPPQTEPRAQISAGRRPLNISSRRALHSLTQKREFPKIASNRLRAPLAAVRH